MDKSEGMDFISKTFSSLSDTIAKFYHAGQKKVSISSLQRSRNEKLAVLGNKVFTAMQTGKKINAEELKKDFLSIVELDKQIEEAEEELDMLQGAAAESKTKGRKRQAKQEKAEAAEEKPAKKGRVAAKAVKAEKAEKPAKAAKAAPKKKAAAKAPAKKEDKKVTAKAGRKPAKPAAKRKYVRKPKEAVVPTTLEEAEKITETI